MNLEQLPGWYRFTKARLRPPRNPNRPYLILGWVLCLAGAGLAPLFLILLESTPLAGIVFSMLIIGAASIGLSYARANLSPEICQIMLNSGQINVSALIEELGLRAKALYLPSSMRSGDSQALIPLKPIAHASELTRVIPKRLIVQYGEKAENLALSVAAPGGTVFASWGDVSGMPVNDIEAAVTSVICGYLDIADNVSVSVELPLIQVMVVHPQFREEDTAYQRCLGSPIAAIIASIASESLGAPVMVQAEKHQGGNQRITIQVLA